MLTAKSEEHDQLNGFKRGADDYVTKPFSLSLLLARVDTILKRALRIQNGNIYIDGVEINNVNYSVRVLDNEIEMTRREY